MSCSIQYRIAARHLFIVQLASLAPGVDDADGDKGEDEEENSDEDGVNLRHYLHNKNCARNNKHKRAEHSSHPAHIILLALFVRCCVIPCYQPISFA